MPPIGSRFARFWLAGRGLAPEVPKTRPPARLARVPVGRAAECFEMYCFETGVSRNATQPLGPIFPSANITVAGPKPPACDLVEVGRLPDDHPRGDGPPGARLQDACPVGRR